MQSEGGAAGAVHGALQARRPGDDVHGQPGPAADDPEHVQDRRRADAGGLPRHGARGGHARAVDLRRSQRRDGRPLDRLRDAVVRRRCRRRRTSRSIAHAATLEVARAVPALLRRLPHVARARRRSRRSTTATLRAMIDEPLVAAHRARGAVAGPSGRARHGAEPRRLLPEPRSRATASTTRRPAIVQRGDGPLRRAHRPRAPAVRVPRRARRRARHRHHGLGAETAAATVDALGPAAKVGVLTVKLYPPFSVADFVAALPSTVARDRRPRSHEGTRRASASRCIRTS